MGFLNSFARGLTNESTESGGSVTGGIGGLIGSNINKFAGGVTGGLASRATGAIGDMIFGSSAKKQGQEAKQFADAAYPGTSPYDQLGGGGAAATIGASEKTTQAQKLGINTVKDTNREQMRTQKEIARKQSLASLAGLYGENPEIAEYLAQKIDGQYKGNKQGMRNLHEQSNSSNRGGWTSPRVIRGISNAVDNGLQQYGSGKQGAGRDTETTEDALIRNIKTGVQYLLRKGKIPKPNNLNYWELSK